MSSAENFGIMEGAYFVGRLELLAWLKDFFGFNYTKVEQCASGAAYCQILDAIYPGKVALHRVKFNAKHEHEFIHNYKILQSAFDRANLKRSIPIELLTRAKYRDNLEFLQWFKRFFDLQYDASSNYNGVVRRNSAIQRFNSSRHVRNLKPSSTAPKVTVSATPCPTKSKQSSRIPRSSIARSEHVRMERPSQNDVTKKENQRLKAELVRIKRTATELEKERDYYFNKLQQMDLLFHEDSCENSDEFVQTIQSILYDSVPNSPSGDAQQAKESIACTSPLIPLPQKLFSPSLGDAKENINGNVSSSPLF